MLRALGPWGTLIVVGFIGMCIWRFEGRRAAGLNEVVDDQYIDEADEDCEDCEDDELLLSHTAMASDQMLPLGPDDCPDFIETLERFVRPSE